MCFYYFSLLYNSGLSETYWHCVLHVFTQKGKKSAKYKIPDKPKPLSKNQLLAEQRKREQVRKT
jgi:hypothetical protein